MTEQSWRGRRRRWWAAAAVPVLALPLALSGCATSPATGDRIFTGGLSQEDEKRIGAEQHPKLVRQFGGEFDDQKVNRYVSRIGDELAQHSELPGIDWEFTVIDSPIVNAFALPGGYIHVTRGLVSLAENEAELAGVIGHEIGHVTARHSAERYGGSVLANVAGVASAIFLGRQAAQAVSALSNVALSSYSRGQELEADTLGVRYLRRAGYDPRAMATFLEKLQANSELQAVMQGLDESAASRFDIFQTHPRTKERVEEAIQAAREGPIEGEVHRARLLETLDGMRYGDSASQGYTRGNRFLHPELGFAFEVPEGFRLLNRPRQVVAQGPDGATIVFDSARTERPMDASTFLTRVWAKDARLRERERIEVNGKQAATGVARGRTREGPRRFRLVAVRWGEGRFYRFMFVTTPRQADRHAEAFRRTTYSLRELPPAEAAELEPLRLWVHEVRPGETVAELAQRMPFEAFRERRFRVLNGLGRNEEVAPGDRVKLVREGS